MNINHLEITGFKSITRLELQPSRHNVFIGESNTGKSNILEVLSLWSYVQHGEAAGSARDFVRFTRTADLFHQDAEDTSLSVTLNRTKLTLTTQGDSVEGTIRDTSAPNHPPRRVLGGNGHDLQLCGDPSHVGPPVLYYDFTQELLPRAALGEYLIPPHGSNLADLLRKDSDLHRRLSPSFDARNLRLVAQQHQPVVFHPGRIQPLPLHLMGESTQRFTLQMAAILSSSQAVIVLPEPETKMHPMDQQILAEQIGMDQQDNQYFITTNSEYILRSILEKSTAGSVAVHIVHSPRGITRVHTLAPEQLPELLEHDPFANADRFLEGEG